MTAGPQVSTVADQSGRPRRPATRQTRDMALERSTNGWTCRDCGAVHTGLVTCIGPDEPYAWSVASTWQRVTGWRARSFCRVGPAGRTRCFARGHLPIPLRGHSEDLFLWNVWVEVSRQDYRLMTRSVGDARRVRWPAVPGVLDTPLPYSPGTPGLPVEVQHRSPGSVPYIHVRDDVTHPLRREQLDGMDVHRLAELTTMLHEPARPTA